MTNKTIVIIGNGFDIDLGFSLSFSDYYKYNASLFTSQNLNITTETWNNFEQSLLELIMECYNNGKLNEEAIRINALWQLFKDGLSFFFTHAFDKNKKINKKSFAYRFLNILPQNSIIYTFNYTNPYDFIPNAPKNELIHVHGEYIQDTFNKDLLVCSQADKMIVGINKIGLPTAFMENQYIRPLIKRENLAWKPTHIEEDLINAESVFIFGFSFGITDSDYFTRFFNKIKNRTSNCRRLIFITNKEESYNQILSNLESTYGLTKNIFLQYNIQLKPIYTSCKCMYNDPILEYL